MRLFAQLSFASLAALASSTVIALDKRAPALDVKLTSTGNTVIKAAVTNTGALGLNLFNHGTFLDSAVIEKVRVSTEAGRVPFLGLRKRVKTTDLTKDAFTPIAPGQTIEVAVDIATVHDLSVGGVFKVSTYGAIPYAAYESTTLTGQALAYNSNELEVKVDGAAAAKVPRAIKPLDKRTAVQGDCQGSNLQNTLQALSYCQQLAGQAAVEASQGSASKFYEYFRTTDSGTRGTVAARLSAVANECSNSGGGATTLYCSDIYGACDSNTLAYTSPSENIVVSCPLYFSVLPVVTRSCHAQDMATTTLHEFTHANGVYYPGTDDNAYGYSASVSLSSNAAVLNADSYALYANAIYSGC